MLEVDERRNLQEFTGTHGGGYLLVLDGGVGTALLERSATTSRDTSGLSEQAIEFVKPRGF